MNGALVFPCDPHGSLQSCDVYYYIVPVWFHTSSHDKISGPPPDLHRGDEREVGDDKEDEIEEEV